MDRKASSGTSYKMAEQLSKIGDVKWIPLTLSSMGRNLCRGQNIVNKYFKKKLMVRMTNLGSKFMYKEIESSAFDDVDVVVAFFCSDYLANMDVNKPIIYFTDATFPAMLDYYPDFSDLWEFNKSQGTNIERKAIANATISVFSSDWAKKSAITDLGGREEQISVIEFGPNIDEKDIESRIRTYSSDEVLNILFLGVDWERKGGNKAVDTCKWLNNQGLKIKLSIVGNRQTPEDIKSLSFVTDYGFFNKNIFQNYKKLVDIINSSHILLLPTSNECSAIAFAEASAFGLPIITHDTGGISNYVINDYNGYRLPCSSSAEEFGNTILSLIENDRLTQFSRNAIELYQKRLNYNCWGDKVASLLKLVL